MNQSIEHEINEWTNRDGKLLGATIYLTPEEVQQLKNGKPVTIQPPHQEENP